MFAIERRFMDLPAELAETGKQQVAGLRDALGDFLAEEFRARDERIAALEARIAAFESANAEQRRLSEQQSIVEHQVAEIATRLEVWRAPGQRTAALEERIEALESAKAKLKRT